MRDLTRKSGTTVSCPTCGKQVVWSEASPQRPFCSERCRMADLDDWFSERNGIPGEPADEARIEDHPGDASED